VGLIVYHHTTVTAYLASYFLGETGKPSGVEYNRGYTKALRRYCAAVSLLICHLYLALG